MSRLLLALGCTAALLTLLSTGALAQSASELEVDHALTSDFPTPHTDWARPYAGGKTRVLFFTTGHNTAPRECVELMQRFDLQAQAVFYATIVDSPQAHWHGGDLGEQRMLKLLDQPWDCYVFLGIGLDKMNAEEQYKLLRPVANGAGLVLSGADDPRVLLDKNRLQPLPAFLSEAAGPVGEAFRIGKGRGLRLPGRPEIGYYPGWEAAYDYWQERLGRAVLWAAGKEPKATVELQLPAEVKPQDPQDPRVGPPSLAYRLVGAPPTEGLRAEVRFRKAGRPALFETRDLRPPYDRARKEWLTTGQGAGDYHADVRILGPKGVVAWATAPYKVTSTVNVSEVKLNVGWGEVGDHITGSVALAGPVPKVLLLVELYDRRERLLKRKVMRATEEPRDFDFTIEPWMPMLVRVEAKLYSSDGAGAEIASAYKYFHVVKRNRGQFNFLIWDTPNGTLAPYAEEMLARTGMTLQLRGGTPQDFVAAYDVAWVPYTTRILSSSKTPEGIMQPFCWNDAAKVAKAVTDLAEQNRGARQHGVFVYSLGDENDTLGCCLSPQCAQAYRSYLRETYGTLEALNREWGTAFKGWDEVGLSKADDNEEANSLKERNYPRWFDRQAFKSYNYVQYCVKHAQAYEAIDPEAKTGFEGAGTFAGGDDLDLIVRSLKFWSPYPGTADEVVRSIAPRQMPRANWMGYTKDADSLLGQYWRMVTRDMDAVWWWRWDCIGAFHGWLAPDLRPYPAVQEIIKDTQVMRDGLGDLLLRSHYQDDGIAVLYSYPSVFAHKLDDGASYGGYEGEHIATQQLLRDLGLQFRYVTDRQLRLGEFDKSKFKLLLLPRADALGDREAQVIREFAQGGGIVIADVRPGLYDDHCKPREHGVLDDLFGVQTANGPAKIVSVPFQGAEMKVKVDPGVQVVSAPPPDTVEGVPIRISRAVGSGAAELLNGDISLIKWINWLSAQRPGSGLPPYTHPPVLGGLQPALKVSTPDGGHLDGVEVTRWRDGDLQLVSLFRQGGKSEPAQVTLPDVRYVYDLRNGKPLGIRTEFTTQIIPNRASLFAVCEQAVPTPKLTLDRPTAQLGSVVKATLSVPGAKGLYAFRLRAKAEGAPAEWLNRNVIAGAEPVTLDLPLALNDPTGKWQISVVELFTGRATTVSLDVKGGGEEL